MTWADEKEEHTDMDHAIESTPCALEI